LSETKDFLIALGLCHQNGIMECWNAGILGVRAELTHFNCKKLLSFNFVQDKLSHHSIIPIGAKPLNSS
jgi:hypothetical protein